MIHLSLRSARPPPQGTEKPPATPLSPLSDGNGKCNVPCRCLCLPEPFFIFICFLCFLFGSVISYFDCVLVFIDASEDSCGTRHRDRRCERRHGQTAAASARETSGLRSHRRMRWKSRKSDWRPPSNVLLHRVLAAHGPRLSSPERHGAAISIDRQEPNTSNPISPPSSHPPHHLYHQ